MGADGPGGAAAGEAHPVVAVPHQAAHPGLIFTVLGDGLCRAGEKAPGQRGAHRPAHQAACGQLGPDSSRTLEGALDAALGDAVGKNGVSGPAGQAPQVQMGLDPVCAHKDGPRRAGKGAALKDNIVGHPCQAAHVHVLGVPAVDGQVQRTPDIPVGAPALLAGPSPIGKFKGGGLEGAAVRAEGHIHRASQGQVGALPVPCAEQAEVGAPGGGVVHAVCDGVAAAVQPDHGAVGIPPADGAVQLPHVNVPVQAVVGVRLIDGGVPQGGQLVRSGDHIGGGELAGAALKFQIWQGQLAEDQRPPLPDGTASLRLPRGLLPAHGVHIEG